MRPTRKTTIPNVNITMARIDHFNLRPGDSVASALSAEAEGDPVAYAVWVIERVGIGVGVGEGVGSGVKEPDAENVLEPENE